MSLWIAAIHKTFTLIKENVNKIFEEEVVEKFRLNNLPHLNAGEFMQYL